MLYQDYSHFHFQYQFFVDFYHPLVSIDDLCYKKKHNLITNNHKRRINIYPILDRSFISRFSNNWFNDELRSPDWNGLVVVGMFWLLLLLNNGAVEVFLLADTEVGWRISSKKFAKIINKTSYSYCSIENIFQTINTDVLNMLQHLRNYLLLDLMLSMSELLPLFKGKNNISQIFIWLFNRRRKIKQILLTFRYGCIQNSVEWWLLKCRKCILIIIKKWIIWCLWWWRSQWE
jgi:hypothetical protein